MNDEQTADYLAQVEAARAEQQAVVWSPTLTYAGDITGELGSLLADVTPFGEALAIATVEYDPEANLSRATFRFAGTDDIAPMMEAAIRRDNFLASLGVFK